MEQDDLAISRTGGWFIEGGFATLGQMVDAARASLPSVVWKWVQGGAGAEHTLRLNRAAFNRWEFRPRELTGVSAASTAIELLEERWEMPVFIAPFAGDGALHPSGWHGLARATARMGIPAIVPAEPTPGQESVAAEIAPRRLLACQVLLRGSDEELLERVAVAARAGYRLVCLSHVPTIGWREHAMLHRAELVRYGAQVPMPRRADVPADASGAGWTWDRLAAVCPKLALPWTYKGVMTADDATAAIRAGASAVYVSNTGGRQLDSAPATLDQLPEIADAVAGAVPVVFDGGVRRGSDIAKALALGADLVGLGRTMAMALAADGEEGAVRALQLLQAELVTTMALLGCAEIADLDRSTIQLSKTATAGGAP